MRDAIEKYLEDTLCYADLSAADERGTRAELAEHLQLMVESFPNSNPTETYAMLKEQFGSPKIVGRGIAAAKGRIRTYFKKTARKLPLRVGIALVLAFAVRHSIAETFYVSGNGVSPMIPLGSRVLVYKLVHTFTPGDVVVYRLSNGENRLGVIRGECDGGQWRIERNAGSSSGKEIQLIATKDIVGRVFINTR